MKKIILIIIISIFIYGCDNMMNTPSKTVENFIGKYQKLDKTVLKELENMISKDNEMTKKEKLEYKSLLEKQYQNLSYKIKSEEVEKRNAIIMVEIEVFDYNNAINKAKNYYLTDNDEVKKESFSSYKIKEMKKVVDKKKYEIVFYLRKNNGMWEIDNLSEEDLLKIHGLF